MASGTRTATASPVTPTPSAAAKGRLNIAKAMMKVTIPKRVEPDHEGGRGGQ